MKLKFHTLDVFTAQRFGGNPLAVVLGADHLSSAQMQTIAREFNLSETTFVMKPENAAHTAKVRIFLPTAELPFAGHPTVGTAILLAELKNKPGCAFETDVKLELKAGLTPVRVTRIAEHSTAKLVAPNIPTLSAGDVPALDTVARALDIAPGVISFDGHRISMSLTAPGFLFVPVKSRDVLAHARIIEPDWSNILKPVAGLNAAYIYARGGEHATTHFRARLYAPTSGVPEDPATGSATVQMAAQLLAAEKLLDGHHAWRFEQGYEMGRPSDLFLEADVAGGRLTQVRLAGQAVQVMEGQLEI